MTHSDNSANKAWEEYALNQFQPGQYCSEGNHSHDFLCGGYSDGIVKGVTDFRSVLLAKLEKRKEELGKYFQSPSIKSKMIEVSITIDLVNNLKP